MEDMGEREGHMKVGNLQQLGYPILHPNGALGCLAPGTVAVPAGMIHPDPMTAGATVPDTPP